jgi:hypothetical protein
MYYKQIIEKIGKNPCDVFFKYTGIEPTRKSYYLYEIHRMHLDWWQSHVWVFNSLYDFIDFLPYIFFNDIAIKYENDDFDDRYGCINYLKEYKRYSRLMKENLDEKRCEQFVKRFKATKDLEVIEFGKLFDLINVSQEEYNKCQKDIHNLTQLKKVGLSQGKYEILHNFHKVSDERPALNEKAFLQMLKDWD